MLPLSLILFVYFIQFANPQGLFGLFFGFQKLCFCRCGIPYKESDRYFGRLLGGESAAPLQFPWLATITTGSQVVTGTLVSDRHVITSASPIHGVPNNRIKVTLGSPYCGLVIDASLTVGVDMMYVHPGFTPAHKMNDLSLLRLRHVVTFSQYVSPICLPSFGNQESEQLAWIASWADNSTNSTCNPRVVALPVVPSKTCNKITGHHELVSSDKGCLGPLGAMSVVCENYSVLLTLSKTKVVYVPSNGDANYESEHIADAGAPVMSRWSTGAAFRLVGVISSASCDSTAPPLYTRISDHMTWINDHIRTDCQCF